MACQRLLHSRCLCGFSLSIFTLPPFGFLRVTRRIRDATGRVVSWASRTLFLSLSPALKGGLLLLKDVVTTVEYSGMKAKDFLVCLKVMARALLSGFAVWTRGWPSAGISRWMINASSLQSWSGYSTSWPVAYPWGGRTLLLTPAFLWNWQRMLLSLDADHQTCNCGKWRSKGHHGSVPWCTSKRRCSRTGSVTVAPDSKACCVLLHTIWSWLLLHRLHWPGQLSPGPSQIGLATHLDELRLEGEAEKSRLRQSPGPCCMFRKGRQDGRTCIEDEPPKTALALLTSRRWGPIYKWNLWLLLSPCGLLQKMLVVYGYEVGL